MVMKKKMHPCGKMFIGIDIEFVCLLQNIARQPTPTLRELFNDFHRTSLFRWLLWTPSLLDKQSLYYKGTRELPTVGTVPRNGIAGPRRVWWPTGTSSGVLLIELCSK